MTDVVEVTRDQYAKIVDMLNQARTMELAAKGPHLNLAQKLAFLKQAKDTRAQAMGIGK